jgi:ligand-binding sensor domain-containing protein
MAVGDPADESVWFATTSGIVHYLPVLRELIEIPMDGMPVRMVFDHNDPFRGLYVATGNGWFFLPRGAGIATPAVTAPPPERQITSLTVEEVLERVPSAAATRSMVLIDERLGRYQFTSVAEDPDRGIYYFGTDGTGVVRFDPELGEFETLPFGLLADRVGAVLWKDGAVWAGTGGQDGRRGFTRMTSDLQHFEWDQGPGAATYQFSDVRALHLWDDGVWAATDIGVLRVDQPDHVVSRDLPSSSTFSLATTPAGLWVGTARGIATLLRFESAGVVVEETQITPGAVLSLVAEDHDVWVGTSNGLRWLPVSADNLTTPSGIEHLPIASEPIVAMVRGSNHLFVATPDALVWREQGATWREGPAVSASVGRITALGLSDEGGPLWIGGDRGVASLDPATSAIRSVVSEADLPGAVRDIHVGGGYVWVATERGLVRLRN